MVLALGLLVILTVEFCLFRVVPDDPLRWAIPNNPTIPLGEGHEDIVEMFDQALIVQYFEFIGDMLTGDFGFGFSRQTEVSDFIYPAMWKTMILLGVSLSLCLLIGSVLGRAVSRVRSRITERAMSITFLALFSIPIFAWMWLFTKYFAFEWRLLPVTGWAPIGSSGTHLDHLVLPLTSIIIASVGAFVLCVKDGHVKASAASSPSQPTLRDGLFAALPSLQFMVAASMLFVACAEWWFSLPGLAWNFFEALYVQDYFVMQATFFLMAVIVFGVNFAIETVVTLARPGRRLDICLREDEDLPATVSAESAQAGRSPFSFSMARGALVRVAKDYLRRPVGVVSFAVFMCVVVIAVVGPWFSSDEAPPFNPFEQVAADLFLDGATALVAIAVPAGVLALLAGVVLGSVAGFLRPWVDGMIAGAMQGLISIPAVGFAVLLMAIRPGTFGYLEAVFVFSVPVMALVALLSYHGFVSARRRVAVASRGATKMGRLMYSTPATMSWALSGLKYGMPLTVITVFVSDYYGWTMFSSWGYAFYMAWPYFVYVPFAWEYVLPPIIGTALLICSIFLMLDTLERVVRARYSELV